MGVDAALRNELAGALKRLPPLQIGRDGTIYIGSQAVYSTTMGDGGVDDITLATPVSGGEAQMYGTHSGTGNGFALREFEVYGVSGYPEVTVLGNGISIADGDMSPSDSDGTAFGSVAQGGPGVSHTFLMFDCCPF